MEGVLCEFRHVHNSKTFVDGLHSVRPNTISQVKSANKNVHRNSIEYQPFDKMRQEFKTFSANLHLDNNRTD